MSDKQLSQDEINALIRSLAQGSGQEPKAIPDFYVCTRCWEIRRMTFEFSTEPKRTLFAKRRDVPPGIFTVGGCLNGQGHRYILFSGLIKDILRPGRYALTAEQAQGFRGILASIKPIGIDYVPRETKATRYRALLEDMRLSLKMAGIEWRLSI